jgi:hypothetical protein
MFGLMKSCTCLQTSDQRYHRRLHYCGTCKTIGTLYGQKSRFFLNSDAVFLGEVLSAISKTDERLAQWDRAYQSYSCFSLPDNPEDMPLSLQFAATATLINAQFKIADRVMDSNRSLWLFPQWYFSGSFRAASARLKLWGFLLAELWECSIIQAKREAEAEDNAARQSAGEMLAGLAEPTGTAAGLIFQHGARVVGGHTAQEAMYALGRTFGTMIYLLDALEDFEKDFRNRHFNALRAAYSLSCERLPAHPRESVTQTIRDLAAQIESMLAQLPIAATRAAEFAARLQTNLSIRLDGKRMLHRACRALSKPAMTFRERFHAAMEIGKSMTGKYLQERSSPFLLLRAPFVFVSASVAEFLLPNQTRSAASYREYMELASNLMLPWSTLRPAMSSPIYFSSPSGPEPPGGPELPKHPGPHKKRQDGPTCCAWCDCCGECGGCLSCCECLSC